jgi:transposase
VGLPTEALAGLRSPSHCSAGANGPTGVPRLRRSFDREFKLQVIRQLHSGERRLAQLCREYDLSESLIRRWKEQYEQDGEAAWPEVGRLVVERDAEQRIRELEAALGRAHLENELLRRALKQAEKGGSTRSKNSR